MTRRLLFAALASCASSAQAAPSPELVVRDVGAMHVARAGHQATPLRDGHILVTGGCAATSCESIQASAERLDATGASRGTVGAMHQARVSHVAAALPDGGVVVAGGWTGSATTASVEVYDASTRGFTRVAPMATPRMDAAAAILADGTVLVTGGATATNRPTAVVEAFDPSTRTMQAVVDMQLARAHHAAVTLADGSVLVVGGLVGRGEATASAERYDPATRRFVPTGPLREARAKLAALRLHDGRVLVLAGSSDGDDRRRLATTEIYDPERGVFTPGPALHDARYKIASAAAVLANGDVLIAGDANDVERWTPGTPAFVPVAGDLGARRAFSVVTALPGGGALVTGGYDEDIRPTARMWAIASTSRGAR